MSLDNKTKCTNRTERSSHDRHNLQSISITHFQIMNRCTSIIYWDRLTDWSTVFQYLIPLMRDKPYLMLKYLINLRLFYRPHFRSVDPRQYQSHSNACVRFELANVWCISIPTRSMDRIRLHIDKSNYQGSFVQRMLLHTPSKLD